MTRLFLFCLPSAFQASPCSPVTLLIARDPDPLALLVLRNAQESLHCSFSLKCFLSAFSLSFKSRFRHLLCEASLATQSESAEPARGHSLHQDLGLLHTDHVIVLFPICLPLGEYKFCGSRNLFSPFSALSMVLRT